MHSTGPYGEEEAKPELASVTTDEEGITKCRCSTNAGFRFPWVYVLVAG